jgi:hypothetical protein
MKLQTSISGHLGHAFGSADVAKRPCDSCGVARRFLEPGIEG